MDSNNAEQAQKEAENKEEYEAKIAEEKRLREAAEYFSSYAKRI